jgi:hypothetical protein
MHNADAEPYYPSPARFSLSVLPANQSSVFKIFDAKNKEYKIPGIENPSKRKVGC